MMAHEIADFLKQEGILDGEPEIRALKGGYWNQVYRVTSGSRRLVVKSFSAGTKDTLFPNLPDDEAKALERLSGMCVAPEIIGYWPKRSILAYEYVEGTQWKGDLAGVATMLKRKEMADASGFRKGTIDPEALMAEGDAFFRRCTAKPALVRPRVKAINPPDRLSLIHTDLGPANIIGAGSDLRIIDWQCPAQGDLCEDVYSFLSPAFHILSERDPLSEQQIDAFIAALAMPAIIERYLAMRPAFAWRMIGYCSLRGETASDDHARRLYQNAVAAELYVIGAAHAR